jgi:hypothetical protein
MARDPHETRRLAPEAWGIIIKILLFFLVISEGAASFTDCIIDESTAKPRSQSAGTGTGFS